MVILRLLLLFTIPLFHEQSSDTFDFTTAQLLVVLVFIAHQTALFWRGFPIIARRNNSLWARFSLDGLVICFGFVVVVVTEERRRVGTFVNGIMLSLHILIIHNGSNGSDLSSLIRLSTAFSIAFISWISSLMFSGIVSELFCLRLCSLTIFRVSIVLFWIIPNLLDWKERFDGISQIQAIFEADRIFKLLWILPPLLVDSFSAVQ